MNNIGIIILYLLGNEITFENLDSCVKQIFVCLSFHKQIFYEQNSLVFDMPPTVTHSKVKLVGCQQEFEIITSPSLVSQTRSLTHLPHRDRVNCLIHFQIFFFLSSVVLLSGQRSELLSFLYHLLC